MSRRCDSLVRHGRLSWITHLPRLSNFHIAGASLSSGSWNKYPLCLSNFLIFCVQFLLTSANFASLFLLLFRTRKKKEEKKEGKRLRFLVGFWSIPCIGKRERRRRKGKDRARRSKAPDTSDALFRPFFFFILLFTTLKLFKKFQLK